MAKAHRYDGDTGIPREIELKLAFRAEDRAKLECLLAESSRFDRQRLVTTYFDTEDRRLARSGIGLRIRKAGGRRVQTVKASAGGAQPAGMRGEWEGPVEGDWPDLDQLAKTPAAPLLAESSHLAPVFRTEVERTSCRLATEDGGEVEAAIDEGYIVAGRQKQAIRELELELKSGAPAGLYRLALRLRDGLALTLGTESKQDRGHALATGAPGPAVRARQSEPRRSWPADRAFRQLATAALTQFLGNIAPTLRDDVEGLHQARVALRRLRAVLVVFKPLLSAPALEPLDDRLRALGRTLGEARDWDVFCLETLPKATDAAKPDEIWPDQLRSAAEACRQKARMAAKAALAEPDCTTLVLSVALALESGALLRDDAAADRRIGRAAGDLLDRQARKVRRRGKHATRLEGAALHGLRKAIKKLRYGIDGLGGLYDAGKLGPYRGSIKRLQKVLGTLNDLAVAKRQSAALGGGTGPLPRAVTDLMARELRRRRRKHRRKLKGAWREFREAKAFWHQAG